MKNIILSVVLLSVTTLTVAANNAVKVSNAGTENEITTNKLMINPDLKTEANPVVKAYLTVKDALVAGNSKAAAAAGSTLVTALAQLEKSGDKATFGKEGKAVLRSATILSKSSDIKAQRTAFKEISEHLYNLLKASGTSTTLYLDYCPMAKATWLSDQQAIANPYYGQSMMTCGSVKDTLKP